MTGAESLDSLAETVFDFQCGREPAIRLQAGLPVERIESITEERAETGAAFGNNVMVALSGIDMSQLDRERRVTHRAIEFYAGGLIGERQHYWLTPRMAPYSFPFPYLLEVFRTFTFVNAEGAERYLSLANDAAAYVDSVREFARGAHGRSVVLPNVEIDAAVTVLRGFAGRDRNSPIFVTPDRTAQLASRERFHDRLGRAYDALADAFNELIAYIDGPYRDGAPDTVGQSQYPGGLAFYSYAVGRSTTMDRSFDSIHQLGLDEIERLDSSLDDVRASCGFAGDAAAFRTYLRSDRRFFPSNGEEIGKRLGEIVAACAPAANKLFSHLPQTPYRVAPLAANLAGSQTFGYYQIPTADSQIGTYFYNASVPEKRSLLSAVALILHELIPGHHFQIARQQENAALPRLRRYDFESPAFLEGYAEYAAELGFDMGAYDDPYDRAGRIAMDMMMSARLVVDTGMNALGWTRERAMAYLQQHTFMTREQIETETLRFACDLPAQALAYKVGELEILRLRARTSETLGPRFSLQSFNDWLIGSGTMTLPTLDEHIYGLGCAIGGGA